MNKTTKFIVLALMAGAMAACNDDTTPTNQGDKVAVQFIGGINISTRAVDDAWTNGDKIGIFMTAADQALSTSTISEGVDNVAYQNNRGNIFAPISGGKTIYFPIDGNVDFYAYYPQTAVNNYKVALNVADQTNQEAIDFMYAKTANCNKSKPQVVLNFNHQFSKLILDIQPGDGLSQDDLTNLTIKVKDQNTTATYNLADGTLSNDGTTADITMHTATAGKKYEAILLPTEADSRVLEFDLNNGHDAPFVWTMATTLIGGYKYHYTTVKLSRTAAEVSGTIVPWNPVTDDNEHIAK